MKSSFAISCTIGTSNGNVPLGAEIWLDSSCVFDTQHLQQQQIVSFECNEDDNPHLLRFVLKNKSPEHTTISDCGEIVEDAVIYIKNIMFDQVNLDQIVSKLAVYQHDFNGTGTPVQEQFHGTMGCNGTVTVPFFTPSYIWILENI